MLVNVNLKEDTCPVVGTLVKTLNVFLLAYLTSTLDLRVILHKM